MPVKLTSKPLIPAGVLEHDGVGGLRGDSVGKYTPHGTVKKPAAAAAMTKLLVGFHGDGTRAQAALAKANPVVGEALKKVRPGR